MQRCNRRLKFELDVVSVPNQLDLLQLRWFKESTEISYTDTRIILYKKHESSIGLNNSNHSSIRAGIEIQSLSPDDSGMYVLKASLLDGLLVHNSTLDLSVLPCHISNVLWTS